MAYLVDPDIFDPPGITDDWTILQAARWAGVAPWELVRQPTGWLHLILSAMEVEARHAKAVKDRYDGHKDR